MGTFEAKVSASRSPRLGGQQDSLQDVSDDRSYRFDSGESLHYAEQVASRRIYFNHNDFPHLEHLFPEVGTSPYSLMLTLREKRDATILHSPGQFRSGIVPDVVVVDRQGQEWILNIKGLGLFEVDVESEQIKAGEWREMGRGSRGIKQRVYEWLAMMGGGGTQPEYYGLASQTLTRGALNGWKLLQECGVRTYKPVAVLEIDELPKGARLRRADDLRKNKVLHPLARPVLDIRALATNYRIDSLKDGFGTHEDQKRAFIEGMRVVSKELGRENDPLSPKEYATWFCKKYGQNLGLLHNAKLTHLYLSPNNVTLDCRIIDTDSVAGSTDSKSFESDRSLDLFGDQVRTACGIETLLTFLRALRRVFPKDFPMLQVHEMSPGDASKYHQLSPYLRIFWSEYSLCQSGEKKISNIQLEDFAKRVVRNAA